MAGGTERKAKAPLHLGQRGALEGGLRRLCWVWLIWPPTGFLLCHLYIAASLVFLLIHKVIALAGSEVYLLTIWERPNFAADEGKDLGTRRAWVRISALASALRPWLRFSFLISYLGNQLNFLSFVANKTRHFPSVFQQLPGVFLVPTFSIPLVCSPQS